MYGRNLEVDGRTMCCVGRRAAYFISQQIYGYTTPKGRMKENGPCSTFVRLSIHLQCTPGLQLGNKSILTISNKLVGITVLSLC